MFLQFHQMNEMLPLLKKCDPSHSMTNSPNVWLKLLASTNCHWSLENFQMDSCVVYTKIIQK